MKRAILGLGLMLVGCSNGGGGSSVTAPETPVTWRGALVTGERPRSALPHLEAGWAQGIQRAGGAGPDPTGWTITLHAGEVPGCPDVPPGERCLGLIVTGPRRIDAAWIHGPEGLQGALAEEFCHYHRFRRGLPLEGGGCPT